MKRLFYVSGTLFFLSLTLLVGIQIGASKVEGKPNKNPFVFWNGGIGVTATGEAWSLGSGCNWTRQLGDEPLPIPVSEIVFYHPNQIITKSGEGWQKGSFGWENCGPAPIQ